MTLTQNQLLKPVPSNNGRFTRVPNGGFNRAFASHQHKPEEFYDLLNFRPLVGKLEQTPPLMRKITMSLLSGESAVSNVLALEIVRTPLATLNYLAVNKSTARYIDPSTFSQTKLPCILQVAIPNNTTVYGQCLLYGFNATDFAADNDQIDVQVSATNQVQWRKNGGAWSSSLTIAKTVPIGSNGLTLAFMSDSNFSGFTVGNMWSWKRVATIPYSDSVASTKNFRFDRTMFMTDMYLGGVGRNVMRVRDGFITSVGYNRMYGKYVAVFQNHLVIGQAAMGQYNAVSGVVDPYTDANTPFNLTWSHLNDPDQTYTSLTNEAGSYTLPYNSYPDTVNLGITGMAQLGSNLYIYLPDAIYVMSYVGLPNVMQTLPCWEFVGSYFSSGLVNTKRGHYFIGRDNFYFFMGLRPQPIGEPVREKFFGELPQPSDPNFNYVQGYYDANRQEVVWSYVNSSGQFKQVVYMEKYNRWYFRNLPSANTTEETIYSQCRVYGDYQRWLYAGAGYINIDWNASETGHMLLDAGSGSMTQPYVETNDLYYQDVYSQKEADGIYIDANWTSGVTGVQIQSCARMLISNPLVYTNANQVWTPTVAEGKVSFPKPSTHGRVLRFNMTFQGSAPVGCVLNAWGDMIYGKGAER